MGDLGVIAGVCSPLAQEYLGEQSFPAIAFASVAGIAKAVFLLDADAMSGQVCFFSPVLR